LGDGSETTVITIVYVNDPGVLGVVVQQHRTGCVVKYYLDGITHIEFLLADEYKIYGKGGIGIDD
jgi:hypothetical protein